MFSVDKLSDGGIMVVFVLGNEVGKRINVREFYNTKMANDYSEKLNKSSDDEVRDELKAQLVESRVDLIVQARTALREQIKSGREAVRIIDSRRKKRLHEVMLFWDASRPTEGWVITVISVDGNNSLYFKWNDGTALHSDGEKSDSGLRIHPKDLSEIQEKHKFND
jgi:hypothetical protein